MKVLTKLYTLDGTGTEIANFKTSDTYERYYIIGTAVATGNYAISISGTPALGDTFVVDYEGTLNITTGSKTFSILGLALDQNQLNSKLEIICTYNGSAWKVKLIGSLDQNIIETANIVDANVTTAKILDSSVTNSKLATNSVTTVKITANNVTNAKLAQMSNNTVKGNVAGMTSDPQDIAITTLLNGAGWTVSGNSGLSSVSNFIGTTDAVSFNIKVNNLRSGWIDLGNGNTGFGYGTLVTNGAGTGNIAIGASSLYLNDTGGSNVAIGFDCMPINDSGDANTAVGYQSLQANTQGVGNTAVGGSSGISNVTGSDNTIIGFNADVSSGTSVNRIALGSGAIATDDNSFALPNGVSKVKFRGITYTLPAADGTAGQKLTTNGSGVLTWT